MSDVKFDEVVGVVVPSSQEIREAVAEAIKKAFRVNSSDPDLNVEPTSPMGQVVDIITAEIEATHTQVAYLASMTNPKTSRGVFLDNLAALYGLERKLSEPTIVSCLCTGLKGTVIPYGAIVQDTRGNQFRHSAAGGVTIGEDGTVMTTFSAVEHGGLEVPAQTVNRIVTVIAGWDKVINPDSGSIGREKEPDGELYNRMIESTAINAHSTLETITARLAELDGVLDVVVLENFTNAYQMQYGINLEPHSIAICIVGGEDSDIAETIYRTKDMGCGTTGSHSDSHIATDHFNARYVYQITRPTTEDFRVRVTFDVPSMPDLICDTIRESIINDFLGKGTNARVKLATTAFATRFNSAVQSAADGKTYPLLMIEVKLGDGAWGAKVEIPATVEPAISRENIEFAFSEE